MKHCSALVTRLKKLARPDAVEGMRRYGIQSEEMLGISIPVLRKLAAEAGKDHMLAAALWKTGIHDARILATMIDIPAMVSERQMDAWASDFDSWAVCDQCCSNLFDRTSSATSKAFEWSLRPEEFVKRAGFVLMATTAVHNKQLADDVFVSFLEPIRREAHDDRNFVRKAVNWALRQIGKRNPALLEKALETAEEIRLQGTPPARWIASDAARELKMHKKKAAGKTRLPVNNPQ